MKDRRNVPAPLAPIETSRQNREDAPPIVDRKPVARIVRRRLDPPDLRQTSLKKANVQTNEGTQDRTAIVETNAPCVAMNGQRVVTIARLIVTHVQAMIGQHAETNAPQLAMSDLQNVARVPATIVQGALCVVTNVPRVAMNGLCVVVTIARLIATHVQGTIALRVVMNDLHARTNDLRVRTIARYVVMNDLRVVMNDLRVAMNDLRLATNDLFVQTIARYVAMNDLRLATNDPRVQTIAIRIVTHDRAMISQYVATNDRVTNRRQLEDQAKSARRRGFRRRAFPATNSALRRCPQGPNAVETLRSSAVPTSVNRRC